MQASTALPPQRQGGNKNLSKCDKITFGILAERRDIFDCNADQCGASAVPSLDKGKLAPNDCTIFHRFAFATTFGEKCQRKRQTGHFEQKPKEELHKIADCVI